MRFRAGVLVSLFAPLLACGEDPGPTGVGGFATSGPAIFGTGASGGVAGIDGYCGSGAAYGDVGGVPGTGGSFASGGGITSGGGSGGSSGSRASGGGSGGGFGVTGGTPACSDSSMVGQAGATPYDALDSGDCSGANLPPLQPIAAFRSLAGSGTMVATTDCSTGSVQLSAGAGYAVTVSTDPPTLSLAHDRGSFALEFDGLDNDSSCGSLGGRQVIVLWDNGTERFFSLSVGPDQGPVVRVRDGQDSEICSLP